MIYFQDAENRAKKQLLAGINTRTFWGDQMLISLVDLDPNAVIPPHSHPHEQVGIVLEGELALTVAGETRQLKPGDIYVVPGGTTHGLQMGNAPARVFEVFSPVREEYKY